MSKKANSFLVASAAAVILGGVAASTDAVAAKADKEKCYGIVAKGKNDCGTSTHSCAAQAEIDNHPEEWIYIPKGLCNRIAGGSTEKPSN